MDKRELLYRANQHEAGCCKCGCHLVSAYAPLAAVFIMDREGNFYCADCDDEFEWGDERIFDLDLEGEDQVECEFCGKEYPESEVEPTSFFGCYCRHCLRLVLFEAQLAIDTIDQRCGKEHPNEWTCDCGQEHIPVDHIASDGSAVFVCPNCNAVWYISEEEV